MNAFQEECSVTDKELVSDLLAKSKFIIKECDAKKEISRNSKNSTSAINLLEILR